MKTLHRIITVAVLCLALSGCEGFLERSASDKVIPTTAAHYKELLQGEAYFQNILHRYVFVSYMTDDIEHFNTRKEYATGNPTYGVGADNRIDAYGLSYQWQQDVESDNFTDQAFLYLYHHAQIASVCIEAIKEGIEGTDEEIAVLSGQAHFIRAFAHFILANLYAQAYNEAKPGDPCIPIKLDPTPSSSAMSRSSMSEVWGLIKSDIETALQNLEPAGITNIYEVKYAAALVLATRIALYMENWDEVIEYGEKFIALGAHPLSDISSQTKPNDNTSNIRDVAVVNFMNRNNSELTWVFGENTSSNSYWTYSSGMNEAHQFFRVSAMFGDDLISKFAYDDATGEGDRRRCYWFTDYTKTTDGLLTMVSDFWCHKAIKYDHSDELKGQFGLRTGEVYISLAEAYARKAAPDNAKAVGYLNDLRVKRIKPYTNLTVGDFPMPIGDKQLSLTEFVWQERRRELCFEELHRWWDLRRTGQPGIVHRFEEVKYILEERDPAYILNFPQKERDYSGSTLGENSRPIRASVAI